MIENEIIIFEDENGNVNLDVSLENDTVWLNQKQLCELFEKDKSVISRHINAILETEDVDTNGCIKEKGVLTKEGSREVLRYITFYNLTIVIHLGFRIKSQNAVLFRSWALDVIKRQLSNKPQQTKEKKDLDFTLLNRYDNGKLIQQGKEQKSRYVLTTNNVYEALKQFFNLENAVKNRKLEQIIKNLYLSFEGVEFISSIEEKASRLLYEIIKQEPFKKYNKQIASFLFLHFLKQNSISHNIETKTLSTLCITVELSSSYQKDTIIALMVNLILE